MEAPQTTIQSKSLKFRNQEKWRVTARAVRTTLAAILTECLYGLNNAVKEGGKERGHPNSSPKTPPTGDSVREGHQVGLLPSLVSSGEDSQRVASLLIRVVFHYWQNTGLEPRLLWRLTVPGLVAGN